MTPRPQKVEPQAGAPTEAAQAGLQASPASPQRRTRPLFGTAVTRLGGRERIKEGYVPRWINDVPGRIARAEQCGYEKVLDEKGRPVSQVVDRADGTKAFLMQIPKEFFEEDFREKQKTVDEIDNSILYRTDVEKGYRPTIGDTGVSRTSMQVLRGGQPFGQ